MLYRQQSIPVQSVVLLDTEAEALAYPRGELTLTLCRDCGFLFNATFDADLVDYASTTEESQHFSGTFSRFARDLVSEIAENYDLGDRLTLEIGCGKGDFLEELVRQTGTRALGIDPGFIPDRFPGAIGARMRFVREYFDPSQIDDHPDLVVCRHTLEHIPHVRAFMDDVAAVCAGRSDVAIMFETPDVARVLAEGAFWDIYHEHCSYFSVGSHARLFRRAGLTVTRSYLAYNGQYIIQYARPGRSASRPEEEDLVSVLALAEAFPGKVAQVRDYWATRLKEARRAGRRTAIWGGGSKGVSFLTALGEAAEVSHVIDINVHKQGKYMPGTGHVVSAPEALVDAPPDLVVAMNPVYLGEIRQSLAKMGLSPELTAV